MPKGRRRGEQTVGRAKYWQGVKTAYDKGCLQTVGYAAGGCFGSEKMIGRDSHWWGAKITGNCIF